MMDIFTIGYEGADLNDFIGTLLYAGVDEIVDVRELPTSRRKGFSKTALRTALEDAGITYRHERRLGSPRDIRHRLYKDHDYSAFFKSYNEYLNTQEEALTSITETSANSIALLCYERDYKTCHRSSVAGALGRLVGVKPKHIGVQSDAQRKAYEKKSMRTRQGISATK